MIYLGADHGGFDLKEKVKKWLTQWGYTYEDLGNTMYDSEDDYPQYAYMVARKVSEEEKKSSPETLWKDKPKGILLCRSATGMMIAANKVNGIRATIGFSPEYAKQSRLHNNTNVIGIGADWNDEFQVEKMIQAWLETDFTNEERHARRIQQIQNIENTPHE